MKGFGWGGGGGGESERDRQTNRQRQRQRRVKALTEQFRADVRAMFMSQIIVPEVKFEWFKL